MLFLVYVLMVMVLLNCEMTPAQKRDLAMCDPGYYAESMVTNIPNSATSCIPCSRCRPGYYRVRSCNATHDAECDACPPNTYSNGWTSSPVCKTCTPCSRHQLSDACTPTKDTLCRTKCRVGYYFDTASRRCKRCSLCLESGGDRVYECTQHEGSGNYQCREGSFLRTRTIDTYSSFDSKENEMTVLETLSLLDEISTDQMTTPTLDPEVRHSTAMVDRMEKVNALMTTLAYLQTTAGSISKKKLVSRLPVISSSASASTVPWAPTAIRHQSSAKFRRSWTATEVLMVLGIIAASCLVSFVTTYVTCYFLMKKGIVKGGDSTVGFARGREPVKGWLAVPRGDLVTNLDLSLRRTSLDMI